VYNEEGLVATNTFGRASFDRHDLQTTDNGQATLLLQSPHLVGRFSDAKLGQVKAQGFGATLRGR
jgi:hypothetical protein